MIADNHTHQPWFPGPRATPQTMHRTALSALLREAQLLLNGKYGAVERLEYQELMSRNFDEVMDERGGYRDAVSALLKLQIQQNMAFMANYHHHRLQPLLQQVRDELKFEGPLPDMILFRRLPRLLMNGDGLWCQAPVPAFWNVESARHAANPEARDEAPIESGPGNDDPADEDLVFLEIHTNLDYPMLVQRGPLSLGTPYHPDLRAAFADVLLAPSQYRVHRTYERRTEQGDAMFLVVRPQQPWETP